MEKFIPKGIISFGFLVVMMAGASTLFPIGINQSSQGVAYFRNHVYTSTHIDSQGKWRKAIYKWNAFGEKVDSFIQDDFPGGESMKEFADMNVINRRLYVTMNNYGGSNHNKIKIFDLNLKPLSCSKELERQKVLEGVDYYDHYFWTCDDKIDAVFKYNYNWNVVKAYPVSTVKGHGYNGIAFSGDRLFLNVHKGGNPQKLFEYRYNKELDSLIEIRQWEQPNRFCTQGIAFVNEGLILFAGRVVKPNMDTIYLTSIYRR